MTTSARRIRDCHVYAISAKGLEHVKIGATRQSVRKRMKALQIASPCRLEILRYVHASWLDEQKLHKLLTRFRITGEWFTLNSESRQLIFRFMDALDAKYAGDAELPCKYDSRFSNSCFSAAATVTPPLRSRTSSEVVLTASVRCQNPHLACKRLARRYWTRGQSLKLCKPCYRRFERHGDGARLAPWGARKRKARAKGSKQ